MAAGTPRLLERERELQQLADAVGSAAAGTGCFVAVDGPAGIGKSRLLAEAEAAALAAGFRVCAARGSPLEQSFAFGVIRQLFEATVVTAAPTQRQTWLQGAASQSTVVLDSADQPAMAVGDFSILHGLYWLTANLGQDRPLLLVVDDLQWADPPSLRFLAYLVGRLADLRVLLVVAVRQGEATTDRLVDQILTSQGRVHLQPGPLSEPAVETLIGDVLGPDWAVDRAFVNACRVAAAGNPLYLRELIMVVAAEGWTPNADNAGRIHDLGSRAVSRHVALRFARLPAAAVEFARAAALIGDDGSLVQVATLARLDLAAAMRAADQLQQAGLLQVRSVDGELLLLYPHPLVRAAAYQAIPLPERIGGHTRMVEILQAAAASTPERIAAHLLPIPATGRPEHAAILRRAADSALSSGAADSASVYLRRCLKEPLPDTERFEVLLQAGFSTLFVDTIAALEYLEEAMKLAEDSGQRARVAYGLAGIYHYLRRYDEAAAVGARALRELPNLADDQAMALQAGVLSAALVLPNRPDLLRDADRLRPLASPDTVGGRELAGVIGLIYCHAGNPDAIELATEALSGDGFLESNGIGPLSAWNCLTFAEHAWVEDSLDAAIAAVHRHGALGRLAGPLSYRMLSRLRRGELVDAEADGRECQRIIDISNAHIGRSYLGPWLVETFIERGMLAEAEAALAWIGVPATEPGPGPGYYQLYAQAVLLLANGQVEKSLDATLTAGRWFAAIGGQNPAVVPWRSHAALCLHALGRPAQARQYATDEVELAQRWGIAGTLGRSLRIAGLVHDGTTGLELLRRAVHTLEPSMARLEHAKALISYGVALHRAEHRGPALRHLRLGVDSAERCGAPPLVELGNAELRTAGARPRRRTSMTGLAALTESERRVAELAARGHSNREIAQQLFVATKTVEVHLSNVYRKAGITRRQLASGGLNLAELSPAQAD